MVPSADILTVHSTPHGIYEPTASLKKFDPTWHINRWLESKVIKTAKQIVPYTASHSSQINMMYPPVRNLLATPVAPGTEATNRHRVESRGAIGFMGREWERKGLRLVMDIFSLLGSLRPDLRLVIAGAERQSVTNLGTFPMDRVQFLGEIKDVNEFYDQIDLLIHPARLEAFGMVVTEALARRIPVLVSDRVGAASVVRPENGQVLPIGASLEEWTENAQKILEWELGQVPEYTRPWNSVVDEYMELYEEACKAIRKN
jgi:UDP-glucose:(heptosyl)LPS alpha-1,3-glucosyltransferase